MADLFFSVTGHGCELHVAGDGVIAPCVGEVIRFAFKGRDEWPFRDDVGYVVDAVARLYRRGADPSQTWTEQVVIELRELKR